MPDNGPAKLAEEGRRAFEKKQFDLAADFFRQAAEVYTLSGAGLLAAEMNNNLSVSLLQAGNPQDALKAALGTDQVFAAANDLNRQAMALGNQAAALEALKRYKEAMVMKSAAALKLKTGKITDSAFKMMGALEAKQKPTLFERILRFLL